MKNKILVSIIAVMALLICVSMVSAAVTVTSSYDDDNPTFGGESQKASNPDSDDEDDENIYATSDITLQNNESGAVTISSIAVNAESGFDQADSGSSGFINISLDDADLTIANGTSEGITLRARIPEKLDAVDSDGDEKAFKVASITFSFQGNVSDVSFDAYMQRENKLELKTIEVTSDEHDEDDFEDGDTVDELKPGENVKVYMEAENNYDEDDELEINDIEGFVIIEDGDMDVDDDEDFSDLDPDEDGDAEIEFQIDSDVDEDDYEGTVYVVGEDEHGAKHGEKWEIEWEVERKEHELVFDRADISPETLACGVDRRVTIDYKIENRGQNDEDEVHVYVESTSLGIDYSREDFEIEEDDDYSKTFDVTISDDVAAGTYPIRFNAYYSGDEDDGVQGDLKDVSLVIDECESEEEEETEEEAEEEEAEEEEEVEVVGGTGDSPGDIDTGVIETEETIFRDSTAYAVLLVAAILVVIGAGLAIIVKLLIL